MCIICTNSSEPRLKWNTQIRNVQLCYLTLLKGGTCKAIAPSPSHRPHQATNWLGSEIPAFSRQEHARLMPSRGIVRTLNNAGITRWQIRVVDGVRSIENASWSWCFAFIFRKCQCNIFTYRYKLLFYLYSAFTVSLLKIH